MSIFEFPVVQRLQRLRLLLLSTVLFSGSSSSVQSELLTLPPGSEEVTFPS